MLIIPKTAPIILFGELLIKNKPIKINPTPPPIFDGEVIN